MQNFSKNSVISLIVVCLLLLLGGLNKLAFAKEEFFDTRPLLCSVKSILFVYPAIIVEEEKVELIDRLVLTLSHFDTKVDVITLDNYHKDQYAQYDAIFFFGIRFCTQNELQLFVQDMQKLKSNQKLCWFYEGIRWYQTVALQTMDYFVTADQLFLFDEINYKNTTLDCAPRKCISVRLSEDTRAELEVLATAKNQEVSMPLSLRKDNFWYFSVLPDYQEEYLVFCDLLHDILEVNTPKERLKQRVSIILRHVGPWSSPMYMRKAFRLFAKTKVPFLCEVHPYDSRTGKKKKNVSDDDYLIRILSALQGLQGAIAIGTSSKEQAQSLDQQIEQLVENDLFPVMTVYSQKILSEKDADRLSKHFSTIMMNGEIPYFIKNKKFQNIFFIQQILPEKITKESMKPFYNVVKKYAVVRDFSLGIEITNVTDRKKIIHFIRYLKRLGYQFIHFREMPSYVNSNKVKIFSCPLYYSRMLNDEVAYANNKKIDLMNMFFENEYAYYKLFSPRMRKLKRFLSSVQLTGHALITIPPVKGLFYVKKITDRVTLVDEYKQLIFNLVLGNTSVTIVDDINRILILVILVFASVFIFSFLNIMIKQVRLNNYDPKEGR